MSYLELEHLTKTFGGVAAVHEFSLSVEQGEFVSLLGPSGCGKTTTLRMVAGFEEPDAGLVRLAGEAINALPPEKRGMGVVFQSYALFPNMTAWGNVAFGLRVAGLSRGDIDLRVAEMLQLVGLQDSGDKYARELSGGQQQRVALARALAIKPRVLLLDEPLSALDAVVRVILRQEIRHIQTTLGITTIYVTHDQEEALSISDRVVVMQQGSIEQVGAPEEIYTQPATRFVATFIGTINQFAGVVEDRRRGTIRCDEITLTVAPAVVSSFVEGAHVLLLVRPESVQASTPGEPRVEGNTLEAELDAVTFLGPVTRLSFYRRGRRIVADVNTSERARFLRGRPYRLSFDAEACQVMPASDSGRSPGANGAMQAPP